jgi:type III restriction enzyme
MKHITLRNFQKKAIDTITDKVFEFIGRDTSKKILFKSPTGSGKTLMASHIVKNIIDNKNLNISFIWFSKGILPEQSRNAFKKYFPSIRSSFLEDIDDSAIKRNEILFINWESVFSRETRDRPDRDRKKGDWSNIYMRDNERDKNLITFCENTRKDNNIILIIDESHLNITDNTLEIIDDIIKPKIRLDISATPDKTINYDYGDSDDEFITLDEVRDEEMIKKSVIINADIKTSDLVDAASGDKLIIDKAIEKRDELLELYKQEKSFVKPLILIQLPSETKTESKIDKEKTAWVEDYLQNIGINYTNGKLAKWLSNEKENLENIENFNSDVEFLIFKQAIATGWDCPRAQILIKFRQTKSETFEVQTVGRIMRSPEFKFYENDTLNRAYVYANLSEIIIDKEAFDYLETAKAKRDDNFRDINLDSVYITRGDYNDIKADYKPYFYDEFFNKIGGVNDWTKSDENYNKFESYTNSFGEKINLDTSKIVENIIIDENIDNIDKEQILSANKDNQIIVSDDDIYNYFVNFIKNYLGGFQFARSHLIIKTVIYELFDNYLQFGQKSTIFNQEINNNNRLNYQKIVLKNKWFFAEILERSVKKYADDRIKISKEVKNYIWNPAKYIDYPTIYVINNDYKKSLFSPFYEKDIDSSIEKKFIEKYLEDKENIVWWYKNGVKNEKYFAIKYSENDVIKAFYPDFIVLYSDDSIGIFDTKGGQTATSEDTKLKANALAKYINSYNKDNNDNKIFGGIVIYENNTFKINQNLEQNYNYKNNNWEVLS